MQGAAVLRRSASLHRCEESDARTRAQPERIWVSGAAVMMQQVAKGVLEEARGRGGRPPVPRGSLADSPLEACRTLLHFRCRHCGLPALRYTVQ